MILDNLVENLNFVGHSRSGCFYLIVLLDPLVVKELPGRLPFIDINKETGVQEIFQLLTWSKTRLKACLDFIRFNLFFFPGQLPSNVFQIIDAFHILVWSQLVPGEQLEGDNAEGPDVHLLIVGFFAEEELRRHIQW